MAKVGDNEPCPCGFGKKYKKCCKLKNPAARAHHISRVSTGKSSLLTSLFHSATAPKDMFTAQPLEAPEKPAEPPKSDDNSGQV